MALSSRVAQRITTVADLDALLSLIEPYRPAEWVRHLEETRSQYEGNVGPAVRAAAKRRYPLTSEKMPVADFNWVATVAFKGSTVYDTTPVRSLRDEAGDPLDDDDVAVKDFGEMLKEARLDAVMPEFDRVRYLAKSAVIYAYSDSIEALVSGKPAPSRASIVWPQDLYVLPNPAAPGNLQAAVRVLWRTGGAIGPGEVSFADWRRDVLVDEAGVIKAYGPWRVDMITRKTTARTDLIGRTRLDEALITREAYAEYPLRRLPFFVCSKGEPSGAPFMISTGGVKDTSNTINVSLMSELQTIDMTAWPILVHTTDRPQPSVVGIGPGVKVNLSSGETLQSITQTADLAGIRASGDGLLEKLALTERQRPGSFTGDEGVESGIALKVKSIPAEKARREDKGQLRPYEEELLLPGMIEIHDHFRGTSIASAAASILVLFPDPPDFETKAEKQTRLAEAVDLGWITKERAAVDAEYYATAVEAKPALDGIAEEKRVAATKVVALMSAPSEKPATTAPVLADTDDDGN